MVYKLLDKNSDYGVDANCNWGWTNEAINRTEYVENPTLLDETYTGIIEGYADKIKHHTLDAFVFDPTPVNTEIAIISTLMDKYYKPLNLGMAKDVDATLAEFSEKMEDAGVQKVIDEMNRQIEEFVAQRQ